MILLVELELQCSYLFKHCPLYCGGVPNPIRNVDGSLSLVIIGVKVGLVVDNSYNFTMIDIIQSL